MELESDTIPIKPQPKFYTAFVMFAKNAVTNELVQLHCTHKYLGVQTRATMKTVASIINDYMAHKPVFPKAIFNIRDAFAKSEKDKDGDEQWVGVLKSFIHRDNFFPDLKQALDEFRVDDYPEYIPHITTDYPEVMGHFQYYTIMCGERILGNWENQEWVNIQRDVERREQAGKKLSSLKQPNKLKLMDWDLKT